MENLFLMLALLSIASCDICMELMLNPETLTTLKATIVHIHVKLYITELLDIRMPYLSHLLTFDIAYFPSETIWAQFLYDMQYFD